MLFGFSFNFLKGSFEDCLHSHFSLQSRSEDWWLMDLKAP